MLLFKIEIKKILPKIKLIKTQACLKEMHFYKAHIQVLEGVSTRNFNKEQQTLSQQHKEQIYQMNK